MAQSPTVARLELTHRIRTRRKSEGIGTAALATKLGFTRNFLSAVENGRKLLTQEKLGRALDELKFDEAERAEMEELHRTAESPAWWREFETGKLAGIAELCGLEAGATSLRCYEGLLISGILQTPDYSRAVISSRPDLSELDLNRMVRIRQHRQERLVDSDPLRATIVMSQAALVHQVADTTLQQHQLQHLLALATEQDNVEIRVIPFSQHPGIAAATLLLFDFASQHVPTLVYQEAFSVTGATHDTEILERAELAWSRALRRTLSVEDSFALIEKLSIDLGAS